MRKLMISAATAAALVSAFTVSSAVVTFEHSHAAAAPSTQSHSARVADGEGAFHHGHLPLLMP